MCIMSMFLDLVKDAMEIFMDDFSIYGFNFEKCLEILEQYFKGAKTRI